MNQNTFEFMRAAVKAEQVALAALWETMDRKSFETALQYILDSNLVITTACGSSGFAAKKFSHSLCCVNKPAKFVPPSEGVHGGMGALQPNNLLILVSKGGKTEELLPMAEIARHKGCKTALVTAKKDSLLAELCDVLLLLPDVPEADRYQVMSTASFSANIAIFDALMMGVMEETGYTDRDFALIHPGGAVGKRIAKP